MTALASGDPALWTSLADVPARVNAFLADVATSARKRFSGSITYASALWEPIDWAPFDIVSIDAYRDAQNAAGYRDSLRRQFSHGKPVAVTEFGCCTYRGAADMGGMGWAMIDESVEPARVIGDYIRDEAEQVIYLRELFEVFEHEGLDLAFWFTFAGYRLPYRSDPHLDLDMASFGIVRVLDGQTGTIYPDMSWEPKQAFRAMAELRR